jgi:hypothetical protein
LSQTPKRPGTKDISELKARLGLKKGAPGAPGAGAGAPAATKPSSGGVVPPPGVSVPAPPGARPPQPAAPNASEDPFGAMNAMAQHGAMQRAPEIIIVNDGKPVESVSTGHRTAGLAKLAAIAVVPLVLGVIVGQIAKSASFYNESIADARLIVTDVKSVKKGLVDVQRSLEEAAKKGFRPDKKITTDIEAALAKVPVKDEQVFRAKQNALNPELAGQLLTFYSGVAELRSMVAAHVTQAKADDMSLASAAKATADAGPPKDNPLLAALKYRYAVVLSNPGADDKGGGQFGAQIVELGPLFCGDKQATPETCGGGAPSFGYRTSPSESWIKGEAAKPSPGSGVAPKQVVPLLPGGIVDSLVAKSEPSAAEVMYRRRLQDMAAKVDDLIKRANSVETKMNAKANEGERFSFFL